MKLTQAQTRAMQHYTGPALVLAVPGAGKTTVLLHRIDYLSEKFHIPRENILSITFSRLQADDMKSRYKQKSHFSTIHAFCYRIIKQYEKKEKRTFRLLEGSDYHKYQAFRTIYRTLMHTYAKDDVVEEFFTQYGYLKNTMQDYRKHKTILENFPALYEGYENFKRQHHAIDFDDMLTMAYRLLDDPKLLYQIQKTYAFVQVDEGQDTSKIQMKIIEKIVHPHNNLFIVADDDQSIYAFRGSDPEYLLHFQDHFENGTLYYLEENHRSQKNIVTLSNAFIRTNQHRYVKNTTTHKKKTHPIRLQTVKNAVAQYDFVNQSRSNNTCILYRSNLSAIGMMEYFRRRNIAFKIQNFQSAYLYSHILTDLLDIIAFSENTCSLQLFEKIYYKLNAYIKKKQMNLISTYPYDMPIIDRLLDDVTLNDFYVDTFLELKRNFLRIQKASFSQALDIIYTDLGYGEYLREKKATENSVSIDFYLDIYRYLFSDCFFYEDLVQRLNEFLSYLKSTSSDTLFLSTIHGAKGLEYDQVILIDMIEGEFPNTRDFRDDRLMEEERRLAYVAITRAKQELILITPTQRFHKSMSRSRFVLEIEELLQQQKRD